MTWTRRSARSSGSHGWSTRFLHWHGPTRPRRPPLPCCSPPWSAIGSSSGRHTRRHTASLSRHTWQTSCTRWRRRGRSNRYSTTCSPTRSPPRPRAHRSVVEAVALADEVELRVRDNGPGMTADQRDRAFDRFWRAGLPGKGTGLGLAIVHRLVSADGGSIELRDAPGGGLEAVIRLRCNPAPNPNPRLSLA